MNWCRRPGARAWWQSERGGVGSTFVVVFVVLAGALGAGYYLGHDVLGGQYLRRSAAEVRQPPEQALGARAEDYRYQLNEPPPSLGEGPLAYREPKTTGREQQPRRREERAPAAERRAPAKPESYTLQVGVYAKPESSQAMVDDLRNRGYSGEVNTRDQDGQRLHTVRTGHYKSRQEAEQAAKDLAAQGYQVQVAPR